MAVTVVPVGTRFRRVVDRTTGREGAMYLTRSPGPHGDRLMVDQREGVARWKGRVLLIPGPGRPVVDGYTVEQAEQIAAKVFVSRRPQNRPAAHDGVVELSYASTFGDDMCATLAFGLFDWAAANTVFRLRISNPLGVKHLSDAHSFEHIKAAMFGHDTTPLVSWLCVLVSSMYVNLSPDLVAALVKSRYADVLSRYGRGAGAGSLYELVRVLVAPCSGSAYLMALSSSVTDTVWWYTYRTACVFVDRAVGSSGAGKRAEPDWVRVDPRATPHCDDACPTSFDGSAGVHLFGQAHQDDYSLADYEFFIPAAGEGVAPVDTSPLSQDQKADLSNLIGDMVVHRLLDTTRFVRDDVEKSYNNAASVDFGLIVAEPTVSYLALPVGFFDRVGEYADWLTGGGTPSNEGTHTLTTTARGVFADPFVWNENMIGPSDDEPMEEAMNVFTLIDDEFVRYLLSKARNGMAGSEASWGDEDEKWVDAELDMIGGIAIEVRQIIDAVGPGLDESVMFYMLLTWEAYRQLRIHLAGYYSDPKVFTSMSLDWYLRLNGIPTTAATFSDRD